MTAGDAGDPPSRREAEADAAPVEGIDAHHQGDAHGDVLRLFEVSPDEDGAIGSRGQADFGGIDREIAVVDNILIRHRTRHGAAGTAGDNRDQHRE